MIDWLICYLLHGIWWWGWTKLMIHKMLFCGVGQSHEVCPDILRFYTVFLKFHIDLQPQLHTRSRVSVPFTHAVFLRAVGQRWLTHSLTYWKETFRRTGRHLVVCCLANAVTEQEFRDDSCLSRFGSRGSDDLQDAQRRFPAQTVLQTVRELPGFSIVMFDVSWTFKPVDANTQQYGSINANLSSNGIWIFYIFCSRYGWLICMDLKCLGLGWFTYTLEPAFRCAVSHGKL